MAGYCKLIFFLALFGSLSNFSYGLDGPHSFVRHVKDSDQKDDIRRLLSAKAKSGTPKVNRLSSLPKLNNVAQGMQHSMQEHLSRQLNTMDPNRKLQAVSANATEDTIAILESLITQLIFWVLGALVQTIIAIILAALSGGGTATPPVRREALSQPPKRRNLKGGDRTLQLANVSAIPSNVTEDSIATILTEVLAEVLPQIIELVGLTLAQAIIDAIISLLTGASALVLPGSRKLQVSTVNTTKPSVTNTTEDTIPILSEVLAEVLPQIIELVVLTLAQAIIDLLVGIITGASIASTPESIAVVKEISTNISASISNVTSSGDQVSQEVIGGIVAGFIPQLVTFAVSAVSDAILGIISGFIGSEDLLTLISGYLDVLEQFVIDFILSALGVASSDTVGSTDTAGLTDIFSNVTANITTAASTGSVTPETIQDIISNILPQIIEAVILIFAQAIADAINEILFGVTSLLVAGGTAVTDRLQSGLDQINKTLSTVNSTAASLDLETVKNAVGKFIP